MSFPLWHDFSDKDKSLLLKNAVWLKCPVGLYLIKQGGGGFDMGMLLSGHCKVVENGKIIGTIKEGELVGEVAFQTKGARIADVIVTDENTEIVFFSLSILKRIKNEAALHKLMSIIQNSMTERMQ